MDNYKRKTMKSSFQRINLVVEGKIKKLFEIGQTVEIEKKGRALRSNGVRRIKETPFCMD